MLLVYELNLWLIIMHPKIPVDDDERVSESRHIIHGIDMNNEATYCVGGSYRDIKEPD